MPGRNADTETGCIARERVCAELQSNWYTLKNFKIGSISAGGYTAFSGAIPIVCEITNNGNSWTYSHLRVYNGIIVGYWN